ncbi:8727_t:CDS:1, partial [Gigaspora rosea]
TEQCSHAPDYTIACLFKNFCILHQTCASGILDIKLKLLTSQKTLIVILKLQKMSSVNKKALYHSFLQKIKDSNQALEETQKPKQSRDTSNNLD